MSFVIRIFFLKGYASFPLFSIPISLYSCPFCVFFLLLVIVFNTRLFFLNDAIGSNTYTHILSICHISYGQEIRIYKTLAHNDSSKGKLLTKCMQGSKWAFSSHQWQRALILWLVKDVSWWWWKRWIPSFFISIGKIIPVMLRTIKIVYWMPLILDPWLNPT